MRWLLALGGLLSVCAPVLAGEWQLDSSCEPYKNKVTSGMERAFTLTSQLQKTLDNIADNKKLEKNEKEIRQVIEWMLLKDAKELNEKTDFTALRTRLEVILGSSKRDDKAKPSASTVIVYCDNSRWKKIEPKSEESTTRWLYKDFDSIIAYDPEFACNKTVKSYIIDSQQSIDSQHSGKTVNQLQICTDFLKSVYKQSGEACNKWCWKRIAEALKNKKQAPIDGAEELATTLFFSLLFTTTKDTKVVACTTKWKRDQKTTDTLEVTDWVNRTADGKFWLEVNNGLWKGVFNSTQGGNKKRDGTTNNPSAIALAAQAINQTLNGLTVNEQGELSLLEE